jgi:cyclopropane fatty-acyl-phospholipid synthase-like methyltransferase
MMELKEGFYNAIRKRILKIDKLMEYIPKRGHLIDLGCSYGTYAFMIHERYPDLKITGVDLNKVRIQKARVRAKEVKNIEFIAGDITKIRLKRKYDAITCVDVFHHVPKKYHKGIIESIHRNLKEGGVLILKDMDTKPYYKYLWNLIHDKLMTEFDDVYYTPREEFNEMLKRSGFRTSQIDLSNFLYAHYAIIGVKK